MVSVGRWRIYWWHERPEATVELYPVDLQFPSYWPPGVRSYTHFLPALRRMFARDLSGDAAARLTDARLLDIAESKLNTGEICLFEFLPKDSWGVPTGDLPQQEAAPFPLAQRSTKSSGPGPAAVDEDVFPNDSNLVAIADVLNNASQSGAPFCEECQKAAAAQQSQQQS